MGAADRSADSLAGLLGEDEFVARHLGPDEDQQRAMLATLACASRDTLIRETVPAAILQSAPLQLPAAATEAAALAELRAVAGENRVLRSYIGAGYHGTLLPEPIRRNILENPGWYTAYTPYQAEISQGRLEALLNFQQMVIDLTGLPIANASLLDEATAAAEAMTVCRRGSKSKSQRFFVDCAVHPQSLAVIRTRAEWLDIEVVCGDVDAERAAGRFAEPDSWFGAYLQNPDTYGRVRDLTETIEQLHRTGARVAVGCDPLSLLLLRSPGAMGADIAVGSAQRFGVPMGFGGPHAAFMAVRDDLMRLAPGRIIGVSRDAAGQPALRMALQTREQHIRREKATSNICTAQALLANMASFYAVYHGPQGLRRIALRVNTFARLLLALVGPAFARWQRFAVPSTAGSTGAGIVTSAAAGATTAATTANAIAEPAFFDTLVFATGASTDEVLARALRVGINLRPLTIDDSRAVGISLDETVGLQDIADIAGALLGRSVTLEQVRASAMPIEALPAAIEPALLRTDAVLSHPVFNTFHSETEFVRYAKRLENRDISLVHSMIPLGSCTMKLNAASEMAPVTWPEFANLHPFVPADQARGYARLFDDLGRWLAEITGFHSVSFQPNSGAQGEYAGMLAIRHYLRAIGQGHRDVCLIPASAHGTNPASASMMGLRIVVVACDDQGNIDVADLRAKLAQHAAQLAALMITYPSTHGVFEATVSEVCRLVHEAGGQVYMDGANLNAQAGLTRPGLIGADVCHLNLHKTFSIPHGGGGPGMGPIAVAAHLAPYLPADTRDTESGRVVSAASNGSALVTTISWMYIRMLGAAGIRRATEVAILNANYVAARLRDHFPILYTGSNGRVAHECILDLRHLKAQCGVTAEDVAKRLMDYGFHAPTLSFPVADTLMVEPTESESKAELDRFCEAMIDIARDLESIRTGRLDAQDNPLKNAPHTAYELTGDWNHAYSREKAAYPLPWLRAAKFWPSVKRIDNAAGDRKLVCTCPPVSYYLSEDAS